MNNKFIDNVSNFIVVAIVFAIVSIPVFLGASLIAWSFNPYDWGWPLRAAFVVVEIFLLALSIKE
jgi:hypothetical protein